MVFVPSFLFIAGDILNNWLALWYGVITPYTYLNYGTLSARVSDVANRGKGLLIDQMQKERNGFFDQLLTANRKMGELETKLLQLDEPKGTNYANTNSLYWTTNPPSGNPVPDGAPPMSQTPPVRS